MKTSVILENGRYLDDPIAADVETAHDRGETRVESGGHEIEILGHRSVNGRRTITVRVVREYRDKQ